MKFTKFRSLIGSSTLKHSRLSKANLTIFILVFAGIGGYILLSSKAASSTANVFVSPNGSDTGVNCKRFSIPTANPDPSGTTLCTTFNKAYQVAGCGDVVGVTDGNYSFQTLNTTAQNCTPSSLIKFTPLTGASPKINGLQVFTVGYIDFDSLDFSGSTLSIDDMGANNKCGDPGTAQYITLRNLAATSFEVLGAVQNVNILGGSYGPAGNGLHSRVAWNGVAGTSDAPCNVDIDGVTIHDVSVCPVDNLACDTTGTLIHTECLQLNYSSMLSHPSRNITVQNSKLLRCPSESHGVTGGLATGSADGIIIRNNFIGNGTNAALVVTYDAKNLVIEYNSSPRAMSMSNTYAACSVGACGPYIVRGNYMQLSYGSCDNHVSPSAGGTGASFSYRYNVWKSDGGGGTSLCGGNLGDQFVSSLDFVNPVNDTDFHLKANASAIDKGDPGSCPAIDIDGEARPAGTACDAGADEYVPAADVWVSPAGNDATCARGDSSKPCLTFDKAYQVAQPGDLVEVGCGGAANYTYPSQRINNVSPARAGPAYVTFKPATGCTVHIGQTTGFDTNNQPYIQLDVRASYITFDGLQSDGTKHFVIEGIPDLVRIDPQTDTASNITLRGFSSSRFYQANSDNVTIENSDFGPNSQTYPNCAGGSRLAADFYRQSHNLVFKNNNVHDTVITGNCHTAGVTLGCGDGVLIDSNKFWNIDQNDIEAIYFSGWCGGPSCGAGIFSYGAVTIQNNFLGKPTQAYGALQVGPSDSKICSGVTVPSQGNPFHDWLIRNNSTNVSNSFGLLTFRGCSGGNCPTFSGNGFIMTGNIIGKYNLPVQMSCSTTGFYPSYNLVLNGYPTCSQNDVTFADFQYINETSVPIDLHLASGFAGISKVVTTNCPAADIDGDVRPQGSACDAGADEYVLGSSTTKPGDVNSDGSVNLQDLSILLSHYGQSATSSQGDLTGDSIVTLIDLSMLLSHYGE